MSLYVYVNGLAAHQGCQLIMNHLDHELSGTQGCEHVHAQSLLLNGIGELLGNLVVDIGIKQGLAYVLQGFGNVNFGDFTFTFQYLKGPFKSF